MDGAGALDATHPGNLAVIHGAVFDGPHEGAFRAGTAAEWLARHAHDARASRAIRRARDGGEGACFVAADGALWHLRRVEGDR